MADRMISGRDMAGHYVQWGPSGRKYRHNGDKRTERIACARCRMAALGGSAKDAARAAKSYNEG